MSSNLSGKTILVTGATSGIGYAVTRLLAHAGAHVLGVGRSVERCALAEKNLRQESGNDHVYYLTADLSLQSEIRRLIRQVTELVEAQGGHGLDGLINNAGTFTYWCKLTDEGVETQWAVNHFAAFLLTNGLLPLLNASPSARIITVSSQSHHGAHIHWEDPQSRRHYNGLRVYGDTKLANILFTNELNRRYGNHSSLRADAVDPGLVNTEIGSKGTPAVANLIWRLRKSGGTSPEVPAEGVVRLLSDEEFIASHVHYWKGARPQNASREAANLTTASRLWKYSMEICGLEGGDNEPAAL